jgi:hypothetical protein
VKFALFFLEIDCCSPKNIKLFDAELSLLILLKIKRHIIKIGSNMLNKLVLRTLLSISLAFGALGAANATLISQDILDAGQVIGNVTINLDDAVLFDPDLGISNVQSFTEFNIYGFDLTTFTLDFPYFDVLYFQDDLSAGLYTLIFDITDENGFYAWAGDVVSFESNNVFTISDDQGVFIFSDQISLGNVSIVPTPATLVLFLTAVVALASRRKNS